MLCVCWNELHNVKLKPIKVYNAQCTCKQGTLLICFFYRVDYRYELFFLSGVQMRLKNQPFPQTQWRHMTAPSHS